MSQFLSPLDPQLASKIKHYLGGAWYETTLEKVNSLFNEENGNTFVKLMESQHEAPLTGTTVQVADSSQNTHLILQPAGTLAALTIKFPITSGSSPAATEAQEIVITSNQTISAVTFDGNGATVQGAPTNMTANAFNRWRYDSIFKTWVRIG